MENINLNIPEVTIDAIVEELTALYADTISGGYALREVPTPFLWGPPGVGKSQGVRQLAQRLQKETGKTVRVTEVRLLLFNPIDLRGLPAANADKTLAVWLRPKIFDMDSSDDIINILFLDELSAAPQSLQAAAYQITLDRTVGEHKLPDNCIVIAAGNRTTDQSVSYKMPKAQCNRLMHFQIISPFTAWRNWAVRNNVDARIIGYLSFDPSRLCVDPSASDMAYGTPRSWSFVNFLLTVRKKQPKEIHVPIAGCIGCDAAVEFEAWCEMHDTLPSVEDILQGIRVMYPKSQDALAALVAGLVAAVRDHREDITREELENVCSYAAKFPPDFATLFFGDLQNIPGVAAKLSRCDAFNEWHRRKTKR